MKLAWILLVLLSQAVAGLAQDPAGVIHGRVVDADTGTGIEDANVSLLSNMIYSVRNATTERGGWFTFDNLPAGKYGVRAYPAGYLVSDPMDVEIDATNNTEITIRARGAATAGTVSGTVRDSDDKPLKFVRVCIERKIFDDFGDALLSTNLSETEADARPRAFIPVVRNSLTVAMMTDLQASRDNRAWNSSYGTEVCAETDAQGHYRTDKVEPGTYFIEAVVDAGSLNNSGTFYPGVADAAYAAPVVVKDQPVTGADIRIERRPVWTVRGEVEPAGPLAPDIPVSIKVYRDGRTVFRTEAEVVQGNDRRAFTIPGLSAGSYKIEASVSTPARSAMGLGPIGMTGLAQLNVGSSDVHDFLIPLDLNMNIRIIVLRPGEDLTPSLLQTPAAATGPPPLFVTVSSSAGSKSYIRDANGTMTPLPAAAPDLPRPGLECRSGPSTSFNDVVSLTGSTFSAAGLHRSECLLEITNLPGEDYVDSAKFDGEDVWDRTFTPSPALANLVITLADGGGIVSGHVLDERADVSSEPATVILIPVIKPSDHPSLEMRFQTGVTGDFELHNVRPGEYHLLAFGGSADSNIFRNSLFLSEYETGGTAVTVEKDGKQKLDTVVIHIP